MPYTNRELLRVIKQMLAAARRNGIKLTIRRKRWKVRR